MSDSSSSKPDQHEQEHGQTIIVNGRPKKWFEPTISFEQVSELAFPNLPPNPNRLFTVTYKHGKEEGSLVAGSPPVHIKPGMIFNVTQTDKS